MFLTVNGKTVEADAGISIAELLAQRGWQEALVAVEHNFDWVRREHWAAITLVEGDRLEVVRIIAGGAGVEEDRWVMC